MTTTSPTRQQTLVRATWQPLATVGPTWQVSGNPWSSNAVVASLPEKKQLTNVQDSMALTAALVNNSKTSTRNS